MLLVCNDIHNNGKYKWQKAQFQSSLESNICVPVLMNLLNSLGISPKMLNRASHFIAFHNLFNKFCNKWALV